MKAGNSQLLLLRIVMHAIETPTQSANFLNSFISGNEEARDQPFIIKVQ